MRLARTSLALAALGFAGFGSVLFLRPDLLSYVGVDLLRPAAATEIRAFYGGLELGLAVFLAYAATQPSWFRPALVVQVAALGGVTLARGLGLLVDASAEPLVLVFGALEAGGALVGLTALLRLGRPARRSTPAG